MAGFRAKSPLEFNGLTSGTGAGELTVTILTSGLSIDAVNGITLGNRSRFRPGAVCSATAIGARSIFAVGDLELQLTADIAMKLQPMPAAIKTLDIY